MSEADVNVVKSFQPPLGFDLFSILQKNAPPAVVEEAMAGFRPFLTPDFVCVYHGSGDGERRGAMGLREVWLEWLEPWESYRTLQSKFIDLHDGRVVVLARDSARREGSEEDVQVHGIAIYTVRDGRIARAEYFARLEDGFAAAGLKPGG